MFDGNVDVLFTLIVDRLTDSLVRAELLGADVPPNRFQPMRSAYLSLLTDSTADELEDAVARSLSTDRRVPVNALADPHHLADTDPGWAGGDVSRIQHLAAIVTPEFTRPALGLFHALPGPAAGALRTGLDTVIGLAPKGMS